MKRSHLTVFALLTAILLAFGSALAQQQEDPLAIDDLQQLEGLFTDGYPEALADLLTGDAAVADPTGLISQLFGASVALLVDALQEVIEEELEEENNTGG